MHVLANSCVFEVYLSNASHAWVIQFIQPRQSRVQIGNIQSQVAVDVDLSAQRPVVGWCVSGDSSTGACHFSYWLVAWFVLYVLHLESWKLVRSGDASDTFNSRSVRNNRSICTMLYELVLGVILLLRGHETSMALRSYCWIRCCFHIDRSISGIAHRRLSLRHLPDLQLRHIPTFRVILTEIVIHSETSVRLAYRLIATGLCGLVMQDWLRMLSRSLHILSTLVESPIEILSIWANPNWSSSFFLISFIRLRHAEHSS